MIVENYRPDVKHRLGIDYEAIKAINPRIVYGSISGFGQDGPYADRPGVDPIVQGMGGHMMVTGEPGRGPMRSGAALSDVGAGLLCANGILTALLEREDSGEGQWVQASLIEAMIFLLDFQAARWTMAQDLPAQVGNNHPTNAPMGVFKTQDGYITIAASRPMWRKLCGALGAPELLERPEYATAAEPCHAPGGVERRHRAGDAHANVRRLDRNPEPRGGAVWADLYARGNLQRPASAASRHRADGGIANVRPDDDYRPSVPPQPNPESPGERRARMWRRYGRHPARAGLRARRRLRRCAARQVI